MASLVGQKFNHWTVLEELGKGKIVCQCDCENHTIKILDKYSVKAGKSKSCGCTKQYKQWEAGQKFGYWTVVKDIDVQYVECRCICGTKKIIQKAHLKNGASKSCGCQRQGNIDDLTGTKINYLTVIKELGNNRIICRCTCGNEKEYFKDQVKAGRVKSCGCKAAELKSQAFLNNMEGKTINSWTIIKELGHNKVICRCSCGVEKELEKGSILNGMSKSCGHDTNKFVDTTNKRFNSWIVLQELGHGKVLCKCECGTVKIIPKATVLNGKSKSCGCKQLINSRQTMFARYRETSSNKIGSPREAWQISAIQSKENFIAFVSSNYTYNPTVKELSDALSINESSIGNVIKRLEVQDYVNMKPVRSSYEDELIQFIQSIYNGNIETNSRKLLGTGEEIDIYLPELKLAIEFNGNYWHSSVFKESEYHQQKTISAIKKGIRLIHIFEYEWQDELTKEKLNYYLNSVINNNSIKADYARNYEIKEISNDDAVEFECENHLQNSANSKINIALVKDNKVAGLMTFSKPKFDNNYEYELLRLCFSNNIKIIDGAEKMFQYFLKHYSPESILTYCNISKFTGKVYTRLGFNVVRPNPFTSPNYIWYNPSDKTTLTRYQTQKSKLYELGYNVENNTEDDIMYTLGYLKIYDSGNLKLEWRREK